MNESYEGGMMRKQSDAFLICEYSENPAWLHILAKGGNFASEISRYLRNTIVGTEAVEDFAKHGVQVVVLNSELVRSEPKKPITTETRQWLLSLTQSFSCSSSSVSSEPSSSSWNHQEEKKDSSTHPTEQTFNAASVDGMLRSIQTKQNERRQK
tara:strand:+ start:14189 stop:14650 length:462 start_codon:yes stop_codon:yes gene_type:complete